jgi:Zn-dependent protease
MRRLKGKIELKPAFVAFMCAYFYFDPAGTFFPFLLAIAVHEAGHLLALRAMRARIHKLRLDITGAVLETEPLRYSHELIVALAGPAVNFLCVLTCSQKYPLFALVNFCLLFYNLLPFYPLDGGRILRALLHLLLSDRAADGVEKIVCIACGLSLTLFSVYLTCVWHAGLWPVLVCLFLFLRVAESAIPKRRFA